MEGTEVLPDCRKGREVATTPGPEPETPTKDAANGPVAATCSEASVTIPTPPPTANDVRPTAGTSEGPTKRMKWDPAAAHYSLLGALQDNTASQRVLAEEVKALRMEMQHQREIGTLAPSVTDLTGSQAYVSPAKDGWHF